MTPHDSRILFIDLPIMLCSFAGMMFAHWVTDVKPICFAILFFGPCVLIPPIYFGASVIVAWILKSAFCFGLIVLVLGETNKMYPFDIDLTSCIAIIAASIFLYEPILYEMRRSSEVKRPSMPLQMKELV